MFQDHVKDLSISKGAHIYTLFISEFDALSRLGVFDPHAFVRNHFQSEKLFFLPTAAIGQQLISQVEATVEETLATGSFTDIMVPSFFSHPYQFFFKPKLLVLSWTNIQSFFFFCRTHKKI